MFGLNQQMKFIAFVRRVARLLGFGTTATMTTNRRYVESFLEYYTFRLTDKDPSPNGALKSIDYGTKRKKGNTI
jgi:hypothetical protein